MADWNKAKPVIISYEGGLSKSKSDRASSNPVPDGSGYHTNKGITWTTFVQNARKYGYTPTPALFYQMPEELWNKIAKGEYWDVIYGDKLKSDSVAILLADWQFGSGNNATKNLQQVLNRSFGKKLEVDGEFGPQTLAATNSVDQLKLFYLLQAERIDYLKQVANNDPSQRPNYEGWINDSLNTFRVASIYAKTAISFGVLAFFLALAHWPIY